MIGAIIILLVTVAVGLVLYVYDLRWRKKNVSLESERSEEKEVNDKDEASSLDHGEICCGRHLICEKSLVPEPGEKIVYYDDEELDRFAGKPMDSYTREEIDEIRDVLLTLLPDDVPGWARSIQLRGIHLPPEIRDELFIMLEDCTL